MQKIFEAPIYRGCRSEWEWQHAGSVVLRDSPKFWVPLIQAFTGARSDEICTLPVVHVVTEDAITFLDIAVIKDGTGKVVWKPKNKSSIRRVPLHRVLLDSGFLAFVDRQRTAGHVRLFPDLKADKYDKLSDAWGKHFARHLKLVGVKKATNCAHSWRHTFIDACRDALVEDGVRDRLTGHTTPGQATSYGRGRYTLTILDQEMQKVSYPGLDLSHLRP
jgi:integrase